MDRSIGPEMDPALTSARGNGTKSAGFAPASRNFVRSNFAPVLILVMDRTTIDGSGTER
ncbi:MAG: hypothetical protein AAGG56_10640 [Pseudomonadota bacterium]